MKLKLHLIGLGLCFASLTAIAQANHSVAISTYDNIAASQEELINNAFLYLNKFWSNKGKSLSRDITEQYFTPDTSLIINGKLVYTGYEQFDSHFKEVSKHIIGKIRFPLHEVISADNKVIVYFDEDIYDNNGNYYPSNVIAIFTIKNNKIQRWEEVVNTKYFCTLESSNVVFSK